ncbi:hypothetical protein MKEN_01255200 [Mycena kentingensis (nom. inval.)]|nr:hypothetical protein MKEN_01255200 [Mycena kentingensis (nom. inval.)]
MRASALPRRPEHRLSLLPRRGMDSSQTAFERALSQYVASLPEKKKKRKFIVACCASPSTPESVNVAVKDLERKNADKPGRRMAEKILGPVISALSGYSDVVGTLASADPMPTALIWGALKVVLDGANRFFTLFETIKKELRSLTTQIERLTDYEALYGDSDALQELFCQSYVNMLRFWCRVDKECDSYWYTTMLKAATPFSTKKLKSIIDDIEEDADQIEALARILEATKGKEERQAAEVERFRQERERAAAQKEREAQAVERGQNQVARQEERYRAVCEWLCARQGNEDNLHYLRFLTAQHLSGTCEWLLEDQAYKDWCTGASSPVIWIYAPPATGKSVLSSRTIHAHSQSDAVVVYHFYRFDQMHTAAETLRILASQLFDAHWSRTHSVPEEMFSKAQQNTCSTENVQELCRLLVKLLPKTCFIIDGLDEECTSRTRWLEALTTLKFLLGLAADAPERVRVWYSSQPRQCIYDALKSSCTILDIQDQVKRDVALYLCHDNPELRDLEVSDEEKERVLSSLHERAEANFLWASLMLRSLKTRDSLADLKRFVDEGLPASLDEYYRRIFDHFDGSHRERSLISKVFGLVVFARRPLRLGEIREAVGLLMSDNPRVLDSADMPFVSRLRALLPPLIEFQNEANTEPDGSTCRLFHSTVRDFLVKNPLVLQHGLTSGPIEEVVIGPRVIGSACLLYLNQDRYAKLLHKHDGRWIDASGDLVVQHRFHLYAAKYWDKHLDHTSLATDFYDRVRAFIQSPNFQTCVQVQSLWVDSQFGVFCYPAHGDDRVYLRRMFPAWFVAQHAEGKKLWSDFRAFLHEWKYFLHAPTCERSTSDTLPYVGELDRCWWPTLGRNNFMSKFRCRYTTFAFDTDGVSSGAGWYHCEGVSADGRELVTLSLRRRAKDSLIFENQQWDLAGNNRPPRLRKTQMITTTDRCTNWRVYVQPSTNAQSEAGRAYPMAFSPCCQYLRIGTQILERNSDNEYVPVLGFDSYSASSAYPSEIEEFVVRGNVVVLASRRLPKPAENHPSGILDETVAFLGHDLLRIEGASRPEWIDSRYDMDDGYSTTTTDSDSDAAEYETWSEGSTELSEGLGDDIITPWAGPISDMDGSSSDSDTSSSSSEEDNDGQAKEDSQTSVDSDESDAEPPAVVGYGRWHNDDKDYRWNESEDDYEVVKSAHSTRDCTVTIDVFSRNDKEPTRLFHFTRPTPFRLFSSPPIIHPTKNLIVFPLSAGDVLFADFSSRTYFIRKLRSSTQYTRQIFMKCAFSPCGSYIHFACLEGQKKPRTNRHKKSLADNLFNLALLISTYRLSSRKTTRSPPSLIFRTRVNLGAHEYVSVSRLSYTLTWTPTHLYFAESHQRLLVKRISLFREDRTTSAFTGDSVTVPRKPIFLPESATRRSVYYFPSHGRDSQATVILGSESRAPDGAKTATVDDQLPGKNDNTSMYSIKDTLGLRSSPMGCYLRETKDFGGWCRSQDVSKLPEDLGIAQLDHRLEKFDPEDDCDLEPYIR